MEGAAKATQEPADGALPSPPEKASPLPVPAVAGSASPPPPTPTGRRLQPQVRAERAKPRARFAECAGNTAADCAAVCCCCPCGVAHLFYTAAVKLPAGLIRRAIRKRRKRCCGVKKVGTLGPKRAGVFSDDDDDVIIFRNALLRKAPSYELSWQPMSLSLSEGDFAELAKEMTSFSGGGFWRSPSQVDRD